MKSKVLSLALACSVSSLAFGSGFGLYQPSTVSHAMGGALVGKAMDASANFNNPATLTDLTNIQVTVGFVTEHPRGRVDAHKWGTPYSEYPMDPGMFMLPHFQLAVPLPHGFSFGFGMEPDYGLGTTYDDGWLLNFSAKETTIQSFVLTPNIAYEILDGWSVGVGLRWTYFEFEQFSTPQVASSGYELGRFSNRLRGDNKMKDFGFQIGTKYDITDTFSVGLVYKSPIEVHVKGKTSNDVLYMNDAGVGAAARGATYQQMLEKGLTPAQIAGIPSSMFEQYVSKADATIRQTVSSQARSRTGAAAADITLPQSITGGFNWDVFPTWHVGAAVSWTQWSKFDVLHFDLQGGNKDTRLDWRDTWRASFGSCWDFAEDWKWMVSYTYDMDCTQATQQSVMLPPANRHILATGFSWNCWKGLELSISYACIFMDGRDMHIMDANGAMYDLETNWGFCHAGGFSVTYRF